MTADHSRITISAASLQLRTCRVAAGRRGELARVRSRAPERIDSDDATVRTVRHPGSKIRACPRRCADDAQRRWGIFPQAGEVEEAKEKEWRRVEESSLTSRT